MKNSERYKTAQERSTAFWDYCKEVRMYTGNCNGCHLKIMNSGNNCAFDWLELDADDMEKVLECPFCGSECRCETFGDVNKVECQNGCACHYQSGGVMSRSEAISRHNRMVRAMQHEKMARDVLNATCDRHARGMTCEECVNVNCPSCPIVEGAR